MTGTVPLWSLLAGPLAQLFILCAFCVVASIAHFVLLRCCLDRAHAGGERLLHALHAVVPTAEGITLVSWPKAEHCVYIGFVVVYVSGDDNVRHHQLDSGCQINK